MHGDARSGEGWGEHYYQHPIGFLSDGQGYPGRVLQLDPERIGELTTEPQGRLEINPSTSLCQ